MQIDERHTRRDLLRLGGRVLAGVSIAGVLAACQSSPTGQSAPTAAGAPPAAQPSSAAPAAASPVSSAPAQASAGGDAPVLSSLSGAERDRVAGLIKAAQGENQLNWLDAIIEPQAAAQMGDAFKQAYGLTNFTLNHQRQQSGQLTAQVQQEVQAGKVQTDVFGVATPRFYYDMKDAGALLQYDSPEYQHYDASLKAGLTNEPGYWLSPVAYCLVPVVNTKFLATPVQSWRDLDTQSLSGKEAFPDVGGSETSLYTYVGLRKILPVDYFKDMGQLCVISSGSSVSETQKLASGELVLSITSNFRTRATAAQTSMPLKAYYPNEGVTLLGQPYAITAKAPHPNTAKLFIDWLFSSAGQSMYVELEGLVSGRPDLQVSADAAQYSPPLTSLNSIPIDWKNLDAATLSAARAEWQQIFNR